MENSKKLKIVSLVPSITELLFYLNLDTQIVGITRYCTLPKTKNGNPMVVGGTKDFNPDKINALRPDIIIANKEENSQVLIEELLPDNNIYITDIKTLEDALKMIQEIGVLFHKEKESITMIQSIEKDFPTKPTVLKKSVYLIWNNPLMTIGRDTFINDMMAYAGFENVFNDAFRYPEIQEEWIEKLKTDFLFLSSEPYAYREHHRDYYQNRFPSTKCLLVDGQFFSWYGSRLLDAKKYFDTLQLS